MQNWIHVPKLNEMPNPPIRSATAYGWYHRRKNLRIFRKVGAKLFVDLDELRRMGEEAARDR